MSMSRMKVALMNSQNQRPCVSRKWRKEGLGRSEFRSQVHSSAAGAVGATQSGPPGRTRSSRSGRWELEIRPRWNRVEHTGQGKDASLGEMTHDTAGSRWEGRGQGQAAAGSGGGSEVKAR